MRIRAIVAGGSIVAAAAAGVLTSFVTTSPGWGVGIGLGVAVLANAVCAGWLAIAEPPAEPSGPTVTATGTGAVAIGEVHGDVTTHTDGR
ncbi:hypothetical protein [Stackebrandtia nassauensis]|uniref:Uncharacterized protein n=1 Tax=Stackebrandtia nassauensis (strain DSM 44728 / CIP 108903 / NRRL B-16338 / NBRC 102104 / LLR-40K-21) TaxID=446470 RepID=D3PU80_STANL|nr:hypothetical protein [Stackebrandtia nassauensis]ADD41026.1 hypothetical protein Snas_1317 [Stackebrandtia nassauensis DSM 44728]